MKKSIDIDKLLSVGFEKANGCYTFIIERHPGYTYSVVWDADGNRIIIWYNLNNIELFDCDLKKVNTALKLCGLPDIYSLKKTYDYQMRLK